MHQPTGRRERRWRQVLPVAPPDPDIVRARRLHPSVDPKEDISKVIVSEFLSLDRPGQPGEAESRTREEKTLGWAQ
jgi:hypothetical protein